MDYKETIKERIKILPEQLRSFVLDEKWRREAEKIGKQFNFDEEKYASFENEIFLVLLCFEPKTDFAENIRRELGVDSNTADIIAEEVRKNIFEQVSDEINSMWQAEGAESTEGPEQSERTEKSSGVGNSFEQIILNQAKAMMPARPADGSGRVTSYEVRDTNIKEEKPANLPTGDSEPQIKVPDYSTGSDPYREPVE